MTSIHLTGRCLPAPDLVQLFQSAGVTVQYYDILAPTLVDVSNVMRSSGPADDDGIRRDALLSWHIWWRWEHRNRPVGATARVRTSSLLILPRWCPALVPSEEERREWGRYLTTVLEHEAGHVLIFLKHLKPFRNRMREFFAAGVNRTTADGNRFGLELIKEHNAVQRVYDEITCHGATQYARLQYPLLSSGRSVESGV